MYDNILYSHEVDINNIYIYMYTIFHIIIYYPFSLYPLHGMMGAPCRVRRRSSFAGCGACALRAALAAGTLGCLRIGRENSREKSMNISNPPFMNF